MPRLRASAAISRAGYRMPGGAGEVRDGDHARARRDGLLEGGDQFIGAARRHWDRQALHHESVAPRADLPGIVVGGMIVVGDQDLVARFEVHALDDDVAAFAGIARDRDFVGGDAQHPRHLAAQRFAHGDVLVAVLERRVGVENRADTPRGGPSPAATPGRRWRRSDRSASLRAGTGASPSASRIRGSPP